MENYQENKTIFRLKACFWVMMMLNFITVTFLALTIVLTQYRIADSQVGAEFLSRLMVVPETPAVRLTLVIGSYLMLCAIVFLKREISEEKKNLFYAMNVLEILLVILLMVKIDMSYNGIIFFVVAEMLSGTEKPWNRVILLILSFLSYLICSYDLLTLFIPMNSFEMWVSFYDARTEKYFLVMRTLCMLINMVLFLVYIVMIQSADRKEKERIRQLNGQLQKANEQLHEFAREKELMGETRERNRLAREIHDTLGHILTGISVGIDAVMVLLEVDSEAAKKQLKTIGEMARKGLNDVRRSVRKLKPDALERMSLENAIHQMIEEMSEGTNTKIYFVSYMEQMKFDADEEETIYRIIQESTTNSIRHGHASEIWIRMNVCEKNGKDIPEHETGREELIIMISDNGSGCPDIKEGFGLKHMRERVELLNGSIYFESVFGFTVIVKIPVRQ